MIQFFQKWYTQGIASTTFLYQWIRDLQYEWLEFVLNISSLGLIISHAAFNFLTKAGLVFMVIYKFTVYIKLSTVNALFNIYLSAQR